MQEFVEAIDGMDNGVSQYPQDITPKYRSRTDLSARVSWLNPAWNESFDSKTVDVRYISRCIPDLVVLTFEMTTLISLISL